MYSKTSKIRTSIFPNTQLFEINLGYSEFREYDLFKIYFEPVHEISNNVVCATRKASDQPAHMRSLIRAFASRLSNLLTEHHLEFLSLKGGCRGSSESTHVKMPQCWIYHATALLITVYYSICFWQRKGKSPCEVSFTSTKLLLYDTYKRPPLMTETSFHWLWQILMSVQNIICSCTLGFRWAIQGPRVGPLLFLLFIL